MNQICFLLSRLIRRHDCLTAYGQSLTTQPGYTYPATYKICTGSASCGRPKPHTGLHRLAPHRCRAAPDWRGFLTAIGSRSFPIGRPFDQTPPVGRTGLDTRPSRQRWGHYWLSKGRRSASLRVRRRISPPCEEGNHAPQYGRVHLSCRARSVTTRRFAGVTRSTRYRLPVVPPRAEDTGSPWGGEERSGAFSHGPHPYRHRHPHILGL